MTTASKQIRLAKAVRAASSLSDAPGRLTRNVPTLIVGTITLCAPATDDAQNCRLLGLPRSGFGFTTDERAAIQSAAPSMPEVDRPHKIPIIDVKLAYLVEEHLDRLKEEAQLLRLKPASRELGVAAAPKRGRRRTTAALSNAVVHLLASRLLLRDGCTVLTSWNIDAVAQRIRSGAVPDAQLQIAAREVRALGALNRSHRSFGGTTTNEALWHLGCHVLIEWQGGMGLSARLSQDFTRDEGANEGVHSELVRLTHTLHAIAVRRLWADRDFMEATAEDPATIQSLAEVYWTLKRIRAARGEVPRSTMQQQTAGDDHPLARSGAAVRKLRAEVLNAQFRAMLWIYHGREVKRQRPRMVRPSHGQTATSRPRRS